MVQAETCLLTELNPRSSRNYCGVEHGDITILELFGLMSRPNPLDESLDWILIGNPAFSVSKIHSCCSNSANNDSVMANLDIQALDIWLQVPRIVLGPYSLHE